MPVLPAAGYATPDSPSIPALDTPPNAYQNIPTSADMFGAASAQALSNLGVSVERAAAHFANIQDEYDKTTALEARTNAERITNRILYGDLDDPTAIGYFGLEGRAKLAARPDTIKQLNTAYDEASRGLTPSAKRLFNESTRGHRLGTEANIALDSVRALAKYREETDKGAITLAGQNSDRLALTNDLKAWDQSVGEGIQIIQAAGERANLPPEVIEANKNTFRANRITEKATALMDRNPAAALEFLDNNRQFYSDPSVFEGIYAKAKEKNNKVEARGLVASTAGSGQAGDETDATLNLIEKLESGGRNIHQGLVPSTESSAQGYFQITNETWRDFAPADVQAKYPNAMSAPYDVQRSVARNILTSPNGGLNRWAVAGTVRAELAKRPAASKEPVTPQTPVPGMPPIGAPPSGKPPGEVNIVGANGQTYPATEAEAKEYQSIKDPKEAQKYLEKLLSKPLPPTATQAPGTPSAAAPTAPSGGIPESPLAAQVARINASNASPEVKEAAIAELHRQHTALAFGQDEAKYEVMRGVARNDPTITPEYIDTLVKTNRISPGAGTEALGALEKVKENQRNIANAIALVGAAKSGEVALDPTNADHKKVVNLDYDINSQGWKPEDRWPKSLDYVSKVNIVPEKIKSEITGNLYSGNEGRASAGARQYRDLVALNPMLGEGFNADAKAMAATLNTMAGLGVVGKEAFAQAQAQMRAPVAEQEARKKAFDTVRGENERDRLTSDTKAITSRHNSLFGGLRGLDPATIPVEMLYDFRENAQTFYGRTGNLDAAYQAAYDTIAAKWAPSTVGADGLRWMKNAPEARYPAPGRTDNSDWMNQQLLAEVNAHRAKPFTLSQLHIVPTPEIPNTKQGYYVWFFDDAGHLAYVQDASKQSLVWRPNWNTSEVRAKEAEALRKAHEERARIPMATAPVPPVPQPPLPDNATLEEKLRRAQAHPRELR